MLPLSVMMTGVFLDQSSEMISLTKNLIHWILFLGRAKPRGPVSRFFCPSVCPT